MSRSRRRALKLHFQLGVLRDRDRNVLRALDRQPLDGVVDVGRVNDWLARWNVRKVLSRVPVAELGADALVAWVAEAPQDRAAALAEIIGPLSGRPSELHGVLLERFGDYGVGSTFYASFMSGSWVGSSADWSRSKLSRATPWLEDERAAVRDWARPRVRRLEEELRGNEAREAEERLLRSE